MLLQTKKKELFLLLNILNSEGKMKTRINISLIVILFTMLIILDVWLIHLLYVLNIIPHFKYTNSHFNIETYVSKIDKDKDGIDDQTDILNGVREYIRTKPKYKSKYYKNGYPDDEYGVCTDVVARGLLNAGYDLKNLVNDHIIQNKKLYNTLNQIYSLITFYLI